MNVSVVITCWNGHELLDKNLSEVIKASENPKNNIKEILVVDDGSTDDSVSFLKNNFPSVKVIAHDKNRGYSATCNTGLKSATTELVVILNLDVVPNNDFLVEALPHFQNEKVFAVSFNEGRYGPGKIDWKNGFLEITPSAVSKNTQIADWASGGSSVFRKSVWAKLRGMDEVFLPFYFEDIDIGLRAQKNGYLCLWEPKAKVIHEHEATINKQNFDVKYINTIKERNHLLLTWKNINNFSRLLSHLFYLGKRCLFKPGYFKIVFRAFVKVV